ncbi:MAG: tyrosine-type recombinase/integrase [Gemmataceae bacterium]|nr:tyrosine-type recombinase/integrase [Gemmataceae bacterium]
MFNQLFERPHALARHRAGPLVAERLRYLTHLAQQGMAQRTLRGVAEYLLAVATYLHLADRPGEAIPYAEIEETAALWADRPLPRPKRTGTGRARERFLWYATQWLQFLDRLQLPPARPSSYAAEIAACADYMSREQGLAPSTISARCWAVRQFLSQLGTANHTLGEIASTQIDEALVEQVTRGNYARTTVQTLACTLRAFFRYAETRGWCRRGLAVAIKAPRVFPQELLPAGPAWDDVRRLLATTEGDQPTDIRDRAILMFLAIYGWRAGEVRRLRLEDFDWEHEVLAILRGKTRQAQIYPLARPVGAAVLRYLQEARPRCARREVFLTRRAPFRPLSSSAVGQVVRLRLHALGVSLPHYGSHTLRHACATHLLEQGLSLKEIGDHLGHRHPDTTRIYTKVDLTGLRRIADFDLGGLQ